MTARSTVPRLLLATLAGTLAAAQLACSAAPDVRHESGGGGPATSAVARDTIVAAVIEAAGTAEPFAQATLSTRLTGTVLDVLVREGDAVAAGATLLRLDARDIEARRAQVSAQLSEAQAVRREAQTQAERMRRLHEDTVATRAQLDGAETALARADAAVRLAQGGLAEIDAAAAYAVVRAPFSGMVTRRAVDPGALAAPGSPLLTIEDGSRLRIVAHAAPDAVRRLRRGQRLDARIEGQPVAAVVEGVVPVSGSSTYAVNAVVENRGRAFLAHSAAVLWLPQDRHTITLIPGDALIRDGDLTGVRVWRDGRAELRWIRVGRTTDAGVEVLSGLSAGERIASPVGR